MDEYEAYLNKSKERLKLSKLAYDNKLYEPSISQSYYAMFLATKSLCVIEEFYTKKHNGVLSFFSKEYINTGKFDKKFYTYISECFTDRKRSDYHVDYIFTKADAKKHLDNAKKFVEEVEEYFKL